MVNTTTSISIDKSVLADLVDSKLRLLDQDIRNILASWQYRSITSFLEDSKNGTLKEAEDDAVCMRNLLDEREDLLAKRKQWDSS